jgi:tetratricopeptide (TPR) repeat protein
MTPTEQATAAIQAGNFSEALDFVDRAIAETPSDSELQVLKGICLAQLQRNDEATAAFRQAITLSPYNAKAYYNLAVHQYQLGNKTEALAMATEAANTDIKHGGARKLIETINADLAGTNAPKSVEPNPMDPLSAPISSMPEPAERPRPVEPAPTVNYPRPGYGGNANDHSLAFVEKMGPGWLALGWLTVLLNLGYLAITVLLLMKFFPQGTTDQAAMQAEIQKDPLAMPGNILFLGGWMGAIVWTILDLVDRRGNFLWLLPQVLCSCCVGFITTPLYILVGRRK